MCVAHAHVADAAALTALTCARSSGVRPFGVSLLAAGYDDDGPHLYQIDPSGSYWAWKASAIGKNMVNAKTFLEKRYNEDIEIEDAIHTAILTLKVCFLVCSPVQSPSPPRPATCMHARPSSVAEAGFTLIESPGTHARTGGLRGTND